MAGNRERVEVSIVLASCNELVVDVVGGQCLRKDKEEARDQFQPIEAN